jgi:hypothetical protein
MASIRPCGVGSRCPMGRCVKLVGALQRVVWTRGISRLVEKHWRSNQQVEERARYLHKFPRLRPSSKVYEGRRARQR